MDQDKTEKIIKIRKISLILIPVLTLAGVLAHVLLSNPVGGYTYQIALGTDAGVLAVIAALNYARRRRRPRAGEPGLAEGSFTVPRSALILSSAVASLEIIYLLFNPDLTGLLVVMATGALFSALLTLYLMRIAKLQGRRS